MLILCNFLLGLIMASKHPAQHHKIRAGRKPADDYKNLRKEVADLKQSNGKLSKELTDLKKRFDASLKTGQPTEKK